MSIRFESYIFEGPYTNPDDLEDKSGVYVILCEKGKRYYLIDTGETDSVKSRIENHDRKEFWNWYCLGNLKFSVIYTPRLQQASRIEIEQKLRGWYDPPCGK